ncbi:MAG: dehydrogenase [Bacteroidales bacterium]|jgi:D-glycero-alpha-D-manno-heptose-7-phosphate kinase|nr:dehydrogenase [Bacteroidales bacterium]
MIIRSKAPLRLGLAGGGTDVSPFSDLFGGAILNATINRYAHASIIPRNDNKIIMRLEDQNVVFEFDVEAHGRASLPTDGKGALQRAVYNCMVRDFGMKPCGFELSTYIDAPPGSGLGTSSTLTVAVVGAFAEWLNLPLGEYDIAHLAYQIERIDLQMAGGKQDQYAATFGGFNFMEFFADDKVIINPLRIQAKYVDELANNLVLFYTQTSHDSSEIIKQQQQNVSSKNEKSIDAMHRIKAQATTMKEALLKGNLNEIGNVMNEGWEYKKRMADNISTDLFERIYETAIRAGASGGKISGAGGGGYIFFYCPENSRYRVIEALSQQQCIVHPFQFTKHGLCTWTIR